MPELPEVETIVRKLRDGSPNIPSVVDQVIKSVDVTWDRIIASSQPDEFKQKLTGKTILNACRRGKFLHFPLSSGHLIGHLRMSGDMRMETVFDDQGNPRPYEAFDKVIINFKSGWRLIFINIRKFGRMWYTEDPSTVFGSLGPEPLDETFDDDMLYEMLKAHNRQIKPLLMDQSFIAGMGNIYADESLFIAKIHPLRLSASLTKSEAQKLHHAIQTTLKAGIQQFGASVDWVYRGGEFQNYFQVYQRKGEPCPRCGALIEKIVVGQRSTHFCPNCQKDPSVKIS